MRILLGALRLVPWSWHHLFARCCAGFFIIFIPIRRRVILENLAIAYGESPPAEHRRILRETYYHTIRFALEMARLGGATREEVMARMDPEIEGAEELDGLLLTGKGFLVASAHMGNWEWQGAWFAHHSGRFGVIYKPMHNAQSDRYLEATRRRHGMTVFSTREKIPRKMMRFVRQGGLVAILADQDARRGGLFVPFFGREASTSSGLASMALRLNVPIVPAFSLRMPDGRLKVILSPPILPDTQAEGKGEERRLTREYNLCVERMIQRAPGQYFWWHRRWKTRPRPTSATGPVTDSPAENVVS